MPLVSARAPWHKDSTLPDNWQIKVSDNGWTSTDKIGLWWLQKLFIPSKTSRTKGPYRLLVLDGHGSDLAPQFDQICSENIIIPICIPPHLSHLLQPLSNLERKKEEKSVYRKKGFLYMGPVTVLSAFFVCLHGGVEPLSRHTRYEYYSFYLLVTEPVTTFISSPPTIGCWLLFSIEALIWSKNHQ